MERVARGIAHETQALFAEIRRRPAGSVLVLAGKGKNAADALIAARLMCASRAACLQRVGIILATKRQSLGADASGAIDALLAGGARVMEWSGERDADTFLSDGQFVEEEDVAVDVVLDGLLGSNFSPPLRSPFSEIIRWANRRGGQLALLRVAMDLPSGLGDGTGAHNAPEDIFNADVTVACGLLKTPLLDERNFGVRGRLRFADGGFPDTLAGALRAGNAEGIMGKGPLCRARSPSSDKRHFGHLFIIGGSRTMPGALLMNVRAALRAGVGLLTVFCPESVHAAFAAAAPEAMWVPWPEAPDGALALEGEFLWRERASRATALLCGSGMGNSAETLALQQSIVSNAKCQIVLDADALRRETLDAALRRSPATPLVLLPHAGEFARIAASNGTLRETCAHWRSLIALKGAPTRTADAMREVVVCAGGPALARGGSGDLLAGITGALFARKLHDDPLRVLTTAVAWHGAAADFVARRHGTEALSTTDILAGMDTRFLGTESKVCLINKGAGLR
ncbi:MAG: NAD(P)H-hydrate dehydratase [Puniceicoccales bacterium]|nr:NAD(P)H-hydrate dehydratase [Puniceicoccales bacterium]